MTQPDKLSTASPASDARDQADAYDSFLASTPLKLTGGSELMIPPHPDMGLLDDEAVEEYNELLFLRDTQFEREPDVVVPEQPQRDPATGNLTGVVFPAETVRGNLRIPYRWATEGEYNGQHHEAGERLRPAWSTRIVQIALGEIGYKRLREGGKSSGDVWAIWTKQGLAAKNRQAADSKSDGSSVAVAPVPEADSQ
jgi:hypothetical protein